MINVLIVDDHPLFRRGLRTYLDEIEGYSVVAEASNGEEAISYIESLSVDVALLDIDLPIHNGFELLSIIRHHHHSIKTVMLTMHDEIAYAQRAFSLGANAYLVKDDSEEFLAECLHKIHGGQRFCSLDSVNDEHSGTSSDLTQAERQIFNLVSSGKSSQEIASLLTVSLRTVDNHRANITKKLGLRGTNALLKYAIQHQKPE